MTEEYVEEGLKPEEAMEAYDRLAGVYDLVTGGSEGRIRDRVVDGLEFEEDGTVLDVGCGTGSAAVEIAGRPGSGCVVGVDVSRGMLDQAVEKTKDVEAVEVEFVRGDALNLPVCGVDRVLSTFTLELFPIDDIPRVLEECRRALKMGGRFDVVSLSTDVEGLRESLAVSIYHGLRPLLGRWGCRPIPVEQLVSEQFEVTGSTKHTVFGLPVVHVSAEKQREAGSSRGNR